MSETNPWVHVELPGHGTFWTPASALRGDENGPLAPEHHMADGRLNYATCFGSDSYGHIYTPGIITRYGREIGSVSDLRVIESAASAEQEKSDNG